MIKRRPATALLRGIGLTDTEAEVYLALVDGEADAKAASESSGVPYSKVHTVLSRLMKKSLIIERGGRPAVYAAKKVQDGIGDYKRQRLSEIERRMAEAEKELMRVEESDETEKSDIWILKSKEGILNRAYEVMSGAKSEIKFALPALPGWVVSTIAPVLTRVSADDIALKMLVSSSADPADMVRLSRFGEIRARDKLFGGGIIADDREAVLFLANEGIMPSLAIWSNNAGLVQVAKTYFGSLWDSARPF